MIFPDSTGVSTIVRKTNPGPPESESLVGHVPEVKSLPVPAHNAKFVPAVVVWKESFSTAAVVVVTGAPVTRYLPELPTVPVIVVAARALPTKQSTAPPRQVLAQIVFAGLA